MKNFKTFVYGILAGLSIGIGGFVFLSVDNKVIGSALFTVGLFCVCTFGFNLFTGKICYVFERDKAYAIGIPFIWLGNLVGTWATAALIHLTRVGANVTANAAALCTVKMNDSLLSLFVLGIFCNILIFIGVDGFNRIKDPVGKYLALFFGVMVFILCGTEHCVADMFYFSAANMWSGAALLRVLVITLGNAVGGVIIPLIRMWKEKEKEAKA